MQTAPFKSRFHASSWAASRSGRAGCPLHRLLHKYQTALAVAGSLNPSSFSRGSALASRVSPHGLPLQDVQPPSTVEHLPGLLDGFRRDRRSHPRLCLHLGNFPHPVCNVLRQVLGVVVVHRFCIDNTGRRHYAACLFTDSIARIPCTAEGPPLVIIGIVTVEERSGGEHISRR